MSKKLQGKELLQLINIIDANHVTDDSFRRANRLLEDTHTFVEIDCDLDINTDKAVIVSALDTLKILEAYDLLEITLSEELQQELLKIDKRRSECVYHMGMIHKIPNMCGASGYRKELAELKQRTQEILKGGQDEG